MLSKVRSKLFWHLNRPVRNLLKSRKMSTEGKEPTCIPVDKWKSMWDNNNIPFHQDEVYPALMKYSDKLLQRRENIKVFVPLCGKSLDMKWLADKGHKVIGVEASDKALVDFFKENGVKYTVEDAKEVNGKLYTSEDKKMRLYCCDFFLFSEKLEGKMDAIWDRGSLVAIDVENRKRYAELMKSLRTPSCQYLVEAVDYDRDAFGGPPHWISDTDIEKLFGELWNVEFLERSKLVLDEANVSLPDNIHAVIYMMTPK